MNSTERRMKLILMLQQSTKRLTVNKIADKFNISKRTVFRDFNALSELNVPVTWDKYTGYGIMRSYTIPPLMFTTKELSTILIGLNFVKSQVDRTMVEDAEGVELKIKEVLPEELQKYMKSLDERTIVDPYLHFGPGKIKGGNWYQITSAISQNRTIEFKYRSQSKNEEVTQRKIDPYLLVFYGDHWNVLGFSHKRQAVRNFVLDRISNIEAMEENFVPYGDIDAQNLIFRSNETSYQIIVSVHKSQIQRFKANLPALIDGQKKDKPDSYTIQFQFDNLDFINKWLLQFPHAVKILHPELLIEKRNTLLEKMLRDDN
jgi:predicted DNA-binding transcriptional regulator YafY